MARQQFLWKNVEDGIQFRLEQKKLLGAHTIPVDQWLESVNPKQLFSVGNLLRLIDEDDKADQLARMDGECLWVSNSVIAALPDAAAQALNLPGPTPLILGLQSRGNIAQRDFSITAQWLESTSVPALRVRPEGCMLKHGGHNYRIPEPLFSIWYGVAHFNETAGADDSIRFARLACLRELLPNDEKEGVAADPYLRNTKIVHAAAFSLHLHTGQNGFQVDPILFSRKVKDAWSETDGEAIISETESLLPEALQEVFAKKRFPQWDGCRDRYGLGNNYYVYIEPGLQKALNVVRKVQAADIETRRNFARNPQGYLKEALADDPAAADTVDRLFVATEQYSQRVVDLGIWQSTDLPWLKREPNSWLPERFSLQIGDKRIQLDRMEIELARQKVLDAMDRGEETVELDGQSLPATRNTVDAFDALIGYAEPCSGTASAAGDEPASNNPDGESENVLVPPDKIFLIVDENYEEISYHRSLKARDPEGINGVPPSLLTSLKPHQEEGLNWLQSAWRVGVPGVLLADDMGLGKTLMALAFLTWLTDIRAKLRMERLPLLVVAPTGLLANWIAEHDLHLISPGLGAPLRAYGNELRFIRANRGRGRDVDLGEPLLDSIKLQEAEWILTTFETLRDYHHSFAKVRFAAAVYDEAQKIKNPSSQLARAAKTVNADFNLLMTGTPVENRLEDLWAIMDIAYPGYLPELKSFSSDYPPEDVEALKRLRKMMLDPCHNQPAVMLRRMKADRLQGLPEKKVEARPRPMPPKQAESYSEIITRGRQASGRGSMLEILHAMRGVSLHPIDPQQWESIPHDDYISWSARLETTFEILRQVAAAKEKALVFVESLDMQTALAAMLKREFHLPKLPMVINGAVSGEKRQRAVVEFQRHRGKFEVMILSPKAGGVGLTLTAANHVIHLSRWWNPAVEDQCTDRIYRIGQTAQFVRVYYPMAVHPEIGNSSFDVKLNELLEKKRSLSRDLLLMPPIIPGEDESTLFRETIGAQRPQDDDTTLNELDRMDPIQFEDWVLKRLQNAGYITKRTPNTYDGGADGLAIHPDTGEQIIVQCKHHQKGCCDAKPIDDLLRARDNYTQKKSRLIAVTIAKDYSPQARERATRHGIELVARDTLLEFPITKDL
ncbi:MAG: SNF2-related protein [Desulfobulbus sp.]|jgi:SNF2 family DNA or RNA helicase/HJR/Mrr/RecB family endonuclease|nr:SNF2-related protein [Desulfobulbus sp.]